MFLKAGVRAQNVLQFMLEWVRREELRSVKERRKDRRLIQGAKTWRKGIFNLPQLALFLTTCVRRACACVAMILLAS